MPLYLVDYQGTSERLGDAINRPIYKKYTYQFNLDRPLLVRRINFEKLSLIRSCNASAEAQLRTIKNNAIDH